MPPETVASRTVIFCLLAFASLTLGIDARAQSTLIPLTSGRGMVFDHGGHYLYISTPDGFIQRYSLATKQIDLSYNLGGSLAGLDIAPDDSFLLVGQTVI